MSEPISDTRRALPSVQKLLEQPSLRELGHVDQVKACAVRILDDLRAEKASIPMDKLVDRISREFKRDRRPSLRAAINATGTILHTGLGRARLSSEAISAAYMCMKSHSTVEVDETSGGRGDRQAHVRGLLIQLTGAEDALVVNNNAGAVLLAVMGLCRGIQVALSRGEVVEIGGAFRMHEIISLSGAELVEVGTTNRTRLTDYQAALKSGAGAILRCHPSNFAQTGFVESAPSRELAALARDFDTHFINDLGSGALIDTCQFGTSPTTTLRQAVEEGAHVVTASGDKLLGGPQCGLLLGESASIRQLARHPLARALRVDKLTLSALEATLRAYLEPSTVMEEIPTLRYLSRAYTEIRNCAKSLQRKLQRVAGCNAILRESVSQVGGGSLPGERLPTVCVAVNVSGLNADELAHRLRQGEPAIYPRIREGAVWFDLRTVDEHEIDQIRDAIWDAAESSGGGV